MVNGTFRRSLFGIKHLLMVNPKILGFIVNILQRLIVKQV